MIPDQAPFILHNFSKRRSDNFTKNEFGENVVEAHGVANVRAVIGDAPRVHSFGIVLEKAVGIPNLIPKKNIILQLKRVNRNFSVFFLTTNDIDNRVSRVITVIWTDTLGCQYWNAVWLPWKCRVGVWQNQVSDFGPMVVGSGDYSNLVAKLGGYVEEFAFKFWMPEMS